MKDKNKIIEKLSGDSIQTIEKTQDFINLYSESVCFDNTRGNVMLSIKLMRKMLNKLEEESLKDISTDEKEFIHSMTDVILKEIQTVSIVVTKKKN